jgi:hypothetical protein
MQYVNGAVANRRAFEQQGALSLKPQALHLLAGKLKINDGAGHAVV